MTGLLEVGFFDGAVSADDSVPALSLASSEVGGAVADGLASTTTGVVSTTGVAASSTSAAGVSVGSATAVSSSTGSAVAGAGSPSTSTSVNVIRSASDPRAVDEMDSSAAVSVVVCVVTADWVKPSASAMSFGYCTKRESIGPPEDRNPGKTFHSSAMLGR